ncbi:AAA family ATPase [Rhodopseudomonas pseudopalustris]|uniref:DNA primase/polymerase bifunctional N-terminal domain-containing protein n=1 Tax=Rhodopseudomonas pseudopalustris TaxID=1513892 RepID=A0A1H8WII7_9BRAD|nr:AAA family ATPase [Rhodopseudomonas pseudopalustris]SEP27237.1 hypothetical protein SAMN05444123_112108 [Rhodopseudomonas pseudopalustris]
MLQIMRAPQTFADYAALGYKRLVPIIPPNAPISETSSLFKRIGTPQDSRGKAVGVRGANGWYGYDWLNQPDPDAADLNRWQRMGAGIGIMTGQEALAIDADTLDQTCAGKILIAVMEHFGAVPTRIGRSPKALYLIRLSAPMQYTRVEFGPLNEQGRRVSRVECLSAGRQFVAHGVHPVTLQPYVWTTPLVPQHQLPIFAPEQVQAFMAHLREILPNTGEIVTEGAQTEIAQASLRGDPEKVRAAVKATPNNSAMFGSREAYRDFGYAIKAALPDDEPEAFEIFADWCARWEDGDNDPDVVAADWRRMKPPFRRGANWLYELAEQHSGGQFQKVDAFFDKLPDEPESLFPKDAPERPEPITIKWVAPLDWEGVTPPVRRFKIANMIPDGEVTLLTGAGGVGKTLLAQQSMTCVALGRPFLGRRTAQCKVMMFLCEDSEDELHLRQRAINKALGVGMADVSDVLRIASRKYMDNLLCTWDRATGTMKRSDVWHRLRDDAVKWGAGLIVVDTIADTFGGSEIDRSQVRQFVQACLGRLAQDIGGAVLALGHPSKAGQAVGGDGTSGSTAWHASVRSRLYLQHASQDGSGPFRRLENRKANYGAAGDTFMLRWHAGAFDMVSGKTLGADDMDALGGGAEGSASAAADAGLAGVSGGAGAAGGGAPAMSDVIDDALLAAVVEAAGEAEPVALSSSANARAYAPKVLRKRSAVLSLYPMDDVEAGWHRVVKAGRVRAAPVGRKANRMPIMSYVLHTSADVFN